MSGATILEPVQQWLRELARFSSEIERLTTEIAGLPSDVSEEERTGRLAELADLMSECAKAGAKLSEFLRSNIIAQ